MKFKFTRIGNINREFREYRVDWGSYKLGVIYRRGYSWYIYDDNITGYKFFQTEDAAAQFLYSQLFVTLL